MHKFHHDNAHRLESPERYKLIPPKQTLERFGLKKDMTFCDIGAGTGFFSRAAAEIVGAAGKVFACDMSEEMLAIFRNTNPPPPVALLRSEEYAVPVPDGAADMTLLSFVLHETPDTGRFVREALRATKREGVLVIIDWKKQVEEMGPPADERLGMDEARERLKEFSILEQGELNASHYYFVLRPSAEGAHAS